MTIVNQVEMKEEFPKQTHDPITKIIETLAGGKSDLRIDIHQIRLIIGEHIAGSSWSSQLQYFS